MLKVYAHSKVDRYDCNSDVRHKMECIRTLIENADSLGFDPEEPISNEDIAKFLVMSLTPGDVEVCRQADFLVWKKYVRFEYFCEMPFEQFRTRVKYLFTQLGTLRPIPDLPSKEAERKANRKLNKRRKAWDAEQQKKLEGRK